MGLRVALCQMDVIWGDKAANIANAAHMISRTDADIVVLPEMFSTGFDMEPASVAETMDGKTAAWLRKTATDTGKAIVCSIVVEEGGKYFNRLLFARPDGGLHKYDKRHLFSFSGEDRNYTGGTERVIIEYKGFRILPLVCYDLRFPVWSRGSDEFDLMIYIASWPSTRIAVWDTLLKARAIENQSYVVGVNRVGSDTTSVYSGHSVAIDYYGNVIAAANEGQEGIVAVELELEPLRGFRRKFPAWRDSDRFEIIS